MQAELTCWVAFWVWWAGLQGLGRGCEVWAGFCAQGWDLGAFFEGL